MLLYSNKQEATGVSVHGFIYKLTYSESQQILEHMTPRMRRKTAKFLKMALCRAMAATSVRRRVWMLSQSLSGRIVTSMASLKHISSKMSGCDERLPLTSWNCFYVWIYSDFCQNCEKCWSRMTQKCRMNSIVTVQTEVGDLGDLSESHMSKRVRFGPLLLAVWT